MLTIEIKNTIQSLWDRLWSGGLSNPISAIEQISYLIFMKRLENFHLDTPVKYRWSEYHNLENEDLLSHVKDEVFLYIKNDLSEKGEPFSLAMEDAYFGIKSSTLLKDVMVLIDNIYIQIEIQETENNQNFQDIQGDIYEYLLKHTSEAGKNGQFRTPRHIIQLITELLEPDLDGKICDLACGSGGFLVGAYQHIITKYSNTIIEDENGLPTGIDGKKISPKDYYKLDNKIFYGFDIDPTMIRIATMNLMMHGIVKPNIQNIDTLSTNYEKYENEILESKFKYILANPPFTGKINSLEISDNLQKIYQHKFDKENERISQSVQSELLFLERIIYMLEGEGKAAVVIPEGVLFSSSTPHKKTRELLLKECTLNGVISMPEGVFLPYTGVKTSILIFEKVKIKAEYDIWFYEMKSDGYTLDTNRRKLKNNPLPKIVEEWKSKDTKKQTNRTLQYFKIPSSEIEKNNYELNFNLYQDHIYKPKNLRQPNDILSQIKMLENEIFKSLNELSTNETI